MAFVHPDAKLGDNNIIGPFCYIDADVVIGDSNVMQNSVTLNQGTRMGSGNDIPWHSEQGDHNRWLKQPSYGKHAHSA